MHFYKICLKMTFNIVALVKYNFLLIFHHLHKFSKQSLEKRINFPNEILIFKISQVLQLATNNGAHMNIKEYRILTIYIFSLMIQSIKVSSFNRTECFAPRENRAQFGNVKSSKLCFKPLDYGNRFGVTL